MGMAGCFAAVDTKTLAELEADPGRIEGYLYPDDGDGDPDNSIDVDKAWHGIHYLLHGSADPGAGPLGQAILGGEPIGDDMGYGPARLLRAERVRTIADALIDVSELRARYAPQAMEAAGVYPDSIWVRDGNEALDYLLEHYRELRRFYRDAAGRGDGVLLWIC
ncbi:DUF1877 family protein [Lysobacter maris]|uniref:DUF1877 family protein n=1 Tax=Marilutibacter maris TaxID=1605891 RepID=A0A508AXB9_9GAMM|nr:YfbM family protein [Lysobacter maris]KAB8195611.1 DUF1877 family protein [Lysobacter maris]